MMEYSFLSPDEISLENKNVMIIYSPYTYGGNPLDRGLWCALLNGEVYDYHNKTQLINDAIEMGLSYMVLKLKRKERCWEINTK